MSRFFFICGMEEKVIFNGALLDANTVAITSQNRGLNYGDALFETIKVIDGGVVFFRGSLF